MGQDLLHKLLKVSLLFYRDLSAFSIEYFVKQHRFVNIFLNYKSYPVKENSNWISTWSVPKFYARRTKSIQISQILKFYALKIIFWPSKQKSHEITHKYIAQCVYFWSHWTYYIVTLKPHLLHFQHTTRSAMWIHRVGFYMQRKAKNFSWARRVGVKSCPIAWSLLKTQFVP